MKLWGLCLSASPPHECLSTDFEQLVDFILIDLHLEWTGPGLDPDRCGMRLLKAVEDIIIVDVHCLVGTKHENLKGNVKILRTHSVDLDDAIVYRCLRNDVGGKVV